MSDAILDRLLHERHLAADSRLYREVLFSALIPTSTPGVFRIPANPAPAESVIDIYGAGHVVQAEQVGPGLAFAKTATRNWQETMEMRTLRTERGAAPDPHVEVAVRVGDLLSQNGRAYPVESVTVEEALYWTLPSGSVDVRLVEGLSGRE